MKSSAQSTGLWICTWIFNSIPHPPNKPFQYPTHSNPRPLSLHFPPTNTPVHLYPSPGHYPHPCALPIPCNHLDPLILSQFMYTPSHSRALHPPPFPSPPDSALACPPTPSIPTLDPPLLATAPVTPHLRPLLVVSICCIILFVICRGGYGLREQRLCLPHQV